MGVWFFFVLIALAVAILVVPLSVITGRGGFNREQRVVVALGCALMVAVAWLMFAPYLGPPNSFTSGETRAIVRQGGRLQCWPAVLVKDPLRAGPDLLTCRETGAIRVQRARDLFAVALGGGAVALWILRDRPGPEKNADA